MSEMKVLYQPWVSETINDPLSDRLEALETQVAALLVEAQRRCLQLPDGEETLSVDPEFTDEHSELLKRINNGTLPSMIKEVRLDKAERNLMKELGAGQSETARKERRLRMEAEFLIEEGQRVASQLAAERERRDPGYSPMRERQLEVMIERFKADGLSDDLLRFINWAVFTPGHKYGQGLDGPDGEDLALDPRTDRAHLVRKRSTIDGLVYFTTECGESLMDLEQNENLRILVVLYMACPSGEAMRACERCIPEGLGDLNLEIQRPETSDALA